MPKKESPKLDVSKLLVKEIYPKIQTISNPPNLNFEKELNTNFSFELTTFYSLQDNVIKIDLGVTIDLVDDETSYPKAGEFAYDFIYGYDSLETLLDSDNKITPEIFITCANISYSTLRGIIYAKSSGSCMENILLPIVTGSDLLGALRKDR